jgi:hypothetical protein
MTLGALLLATWVSSAARAATYCPLPEGGSSELGRIDGFRRLEFIDERMYHAEHVARLWSYSWGTGIALAGVGSLIPVPYVAEQNRVDWYSGAVSAAVGVAAFVFDPPAALSQGPPLHERIAQALPGPDVCALLADAETRLVRTARDEQTQRAWYAHLGNVLFNAGVGLFLGIGYHHWSSGAINAISGVVVGEGILFTSPTTATHARDDYFTARF